MMVASTRRMSMGFDRCASMPLASEAFTSSANAFAVSAMIFTSAAQAPAQARIARAAARASRDPDDEYLADITAHPDREETVSRPASGGQSAGGRDAAPAEKLGFCRHRVFGRGKIVEALPPDKYRVNFPGFGLKVILAAYLSMEE